MLSEKEIYEIYGKTIWEMTPSELIENHLDKVWFALIEEQED